MSAWFNYAATCKILVFGLLIGAALPALFALGVRLHAADPGDVTKSAPAAPRPLLVALSWAIFALVLAMVTLGVLYIARDFLADHLGFPFLPAGPTVTSHSVSP